MSNTEQSSFQFSRQRWLALFVAGSLLALLFVALGGSPNRASAMEIDCTSIGGAGHLPDYVEDWGVRCSGGGGGSGGGGTGSGGGSGGCIVGIDSVPEGFFTPFRRTDGISTIESKYSPGDESTWTTMKFYRIGPNGYYLAGIMTVWETLTSSGIDFYNFMSGAVQRAHYDNSMPCSGGYGYENWSSPDLGDSAASATPLVAPGIVSSAVGSSGSRGSLTPISTAAGKYLLRLDVTNNNVTSRTPASVSMIMSDFDVDSVVAHTGGVDCTSTAMGIEDCTVAEMAPKATQSMTLLLTAHPGTVADLDVPIMVSSLTVGMGAHRTHAGNMFYSATPAPSVVIDPVPTPPWCTATEPGVQSVVAGLLSSLTTTCLNGLPMKVVAEHGTASIDSHGTLSYTPDLAYRGTDTLSVTASNAHGRVSAPTAVEVTVVDPPHAEADSFTVRAGTTFASTVSVLENDSINGGKALPLPIGWSAQQNATSSEHGRVILSPDGTFAYTPESGFSGLDTFEYQLEGRNSAVSNTVTVTLRVVVP